MAYDGGSSVRRRRRSGGAANPFAIFGSRLMLWNDWSDISTLYQDSTFTTPVAALNDPIGGIKDKSGNSNHATQGTSASRPLWKQDGNGCFNALLDGTDDSWATAAIDFSGSDKVAVFAAVRKLSDAATGMLVELSPAAGAGSFSLRAPQGAAATFSFASSGSIGVTATSPTSYAAPTTAVLSGIGDISSDRATLYVNGTQVAQVTSDQGTGNYGASYTVNIGSRAGASLRLNAALYQLFIVQGAVTAAEIAAANVYCNSKSRAY